jgi:8-oxo-dGTP diphosphatase
MPNSNLEANYPRVGVGVIITRGDTVLLGKRINAHGDGTWSFPGGHLEFKESIEDCAKREVSEETGLEISVLRYEPYTNDIFVDENKHYITLFVVAQSESGDPQILEPSKCAEWRWVKWEALEDFQPLFLPIQNLLKLGFSPSVD